MLVGVYPSQQSDTEKSYEEYSKKFKDVAKRSPTNEIMFEPSGTNNYGHPLWLLLVEERRDGRAAFVGTSITWLNRKRTVVVLFEGQYASDSPTDMGRDRSTFRSAAEQVLRSVR